MRWNKLPVLLLCVAAASAQTPAESTTPNTSAMQQSTVLLVTDTIAVSGRCNHCKERIEKLALELPGVQSAQWDRRSKLLTVIYDPAQVSREQIQAKLASGGHDTEEYTAPDEAYNRLPKCCRYRSP